MVTKLTRDPVAEEPMTSSGLLAPLGFMLVISHCLVLRTLQGEHKPPQLPYIPGTGHHQSRQGSVISN